ncbi:MAG: helix-turn-helix domain-containing protein, partial [Anaerolineaceae bacterium]|nr:helix-turn-helix domain-containing protein [Anaerolineaceae bacterium]
MPESIGKFLFKARTERGLTLEEVSTATHNKLHYLKAIEADQRDVLPSEAQYRGFLRLYAGYLNLPTELWLNTGAEIVSTPPEDFQPNVRNEGAPLLQTPGKTTRKPSTATPQVPPASAPGVEPPETSEALSAAKLLPSQEIFQQLGSTLRNRRDALELRLQDIEHHL